jgi:predicted metalloprotease with PDZ domain
MKRTFSIFGMILLAGASMAMAQGPEQKINEKEARGGDGCGFLGVYPTNVPTEAVEALRLPNRQGAIIDGVIDGTPAAATGIAAKDVVVAWNGEKVIGEPQFRKMVLGTKPGTMVKVDVIRDGQPLQLTVQALGGRPDCETIRRVPMHADPRLGQELGDAERKIREAERRIEIAELRMRESMNLPGFVVINEQGRIGATVQNVSPQLGKYFGLEGRSGALVNSVAENSAGARGGLQAGDVILSVDGANVNDPKAFMEALRNKEGKITLGIIRDRQEMTITVDLGSAVKSPVRPTPTTPEAPKGPEGNAAPELGSSLFDGNGSSTLGAVMFGN